MPKTKLMIGQTIIPINGWLPKKGKSKNIRIIRPYWFRFSSHSIAVSLGRRPKRIFEPSKGGTGIRLKIAKPTERIMVVRSRVGRIGTCITPGKRRRELKMPAKTRLLAGPAKEIKAVSRRGSLRLKGSMGTGLPQPIWKIKRAKVPIGSRWAIGFKVSRSLTRGVGSPNLSATQAWANS